MAKVTAAQLENDKQHCLDAKRIMLRDGNTLVLADGECTTLYWHLLECEECEGLTNNAKTTSKEV